MSCHLIKKFKEQKLKDRLSHMITFSPPCPPTYSLVTNNTVLQRGPQYTQCRFISKHPMIFPWISVECFQLKKTGSKNRIVTLYIKNKSGKNTKKNTIVYSHGNSSDLGTIYPMLIDMSSVLKCDIIAYDYTGYGHSEGTPSEREIKSDIEQVLDFATVNLQLDINDIILFGSSIGSVPCFHIASFSQYWAINGLILTSPLWSGCFLMDSSKWNYEENIDVLSNRSLSKELLCPVLIIHGALDSVVPINNSIELCKEMKSCFTWYPSQGTHGNLITKYRSKFYLKMTNFIEYWETNRTNKNKLLWDSAKNWSNLDTTVITLALK